MTAPLYVVIAFGFTSPHEQPKVQRLFQDEVLRLFGELAMDGHGNTSTVVSVAVREDKPRKGKITSGAWGDNGR